MKDFSTHTIWDKRGYKFNRIHGVKKCSSDAIAASNKKIRIN